MICREAMGKSLKDVGEVPLVDILARAALRRSIWSSLSIIIISILSLPLRWQGFFRRRPGPHVEQSVTPLCDANSLSDGWKHFIWELRALWLFGMLALLKSACVLTEFTPLQLWVVGYLCLSVPTDIDITVTIRYNSKTALRRRLIYRIPPTNTLSNSCSGQNAMIVLHCYCIISVFFSYFSIFN